jgi:hypothetical protein
LVMLKYNIKEPERIIYNMGSKYETFYNLKSNVYVLCIFIYLCFIKDAVRNARNA